jgi:hypothetical protein
MELTDDEREADYQALLASLDMLKNDKDYFDDYPGNTDMTIMEHIEYKAMLLRGN